MRQSTAIVMAALMVLSVAAVPAAGLAATGEAGPAQTDDGTETATNGTDANETADDNASVAPGERLSGVVGVQKAEIEGEVDERAFGIRVAQAASNDSRAEVVRGQLGDIEQRLDRLEQRKQELDRNRGNMSEGRYRAEVSELATQTRTAERLANHSENVSRGMPANVLAANNISVENIQMLRERAHNMTGPEVAEMARGIAGPGFGSPPGDRGPGEMPGRHGQGGPDERPGPRGGMDDGERMPGRDATGGQQDDGVVDGNTTDGNVTDGTTTGGNATDGTTDGDRGDGRHMDGSDDETTRQRGGR